jgi:dipeptidyl-peptidase-4
MNDDFYFLKDNKHLILASERDGFDHLYRFTLKGELVNQITKGDWAMCSSGGSAFWVKRGVTGIDEDGGWIYFTSLEKSSLERQLYRIRFDGKNMERLTTGDGTHSITMSPNAKYYFDRFSNTTTPPSLTLCDARGKVKMSLATPEWGGFKSFGIQAPELLSIPARDGFKLPASITKPRDFDPNKKYPVIVEVYGGPSAPTVSNSFQFNVWDNVLGNNGYICVKIDNRAATGISKKLENLIVNRSPGEIELNDLVDGVRWFKQQPYVDPDRIGVTGWSGGGTNTVLAMTRSTEFKAGIAGGTVTDFRFYDSKWGESLMKTEKENLKGYEENSLLKYAKDLHGRLLLVHGTHDDNVHIQNIWRFINELIKANKLFDLMVYPLRGHGVGDPAGSRHLNNVELDFWKRNL